jgi:hypothetical protein
MYPWMAPPSRSLRMSLVSAVSTWGVGVEEQLGRGIVWSMGIEVIFVFGEDAAEMSGVEDQHSVAEFSAETAGPAFHDRVCAGRPDRSRDDLDVLAGQDCIEHAGELRVPVPDHELELFTTIAEIHEQVAGLLGDPVCAGMRGNAEDVDPAGGVFDNREAVQPGEQHGVAVEEVARQDPTGLGAQELGPGGAGASWGRIDSGALKDRPDRGGADLAAQPVSSPVMCRYPQSGFLAARLWVPKTSSALVSGVALAENLIRACYAACRYSWSMPPRCSCRRMSR